MSLDKPDQGARPRMLSRRGVAIAAALALLVASFPWSAPQPAPAAAQVAGGATLTILAAPVTVQRTSSGFRSDGVSGETLEVGDRVFAGPGGRARVTFFDGSEVDVDPETEVRVNRMDQLGDGGTGVSIGLALGTTISRIPQLVTPSSSYSVRTPGAVALVRGTTVQNSVRSDLQEVHRSLDGAFDLAAAGVTRRVQDGETVIVPPPPPAARGVAAAPESAPSGPTPGVVAARRVTICHGTGSVENPFQTIVVDANSVDGNRTLQGHQAHIDAGGDLLFEGTVDCGAVATARITATPTPTATSTPQLATATPTSPPAQRSGPFFYGMMLASPDPASGGSADLTKQAGFSHIWLFVNWGNVEPNKGDLLFKKKNQFGQTVANDLTNVLELAKKYNLKFVLRLNSPPGWAGGAVYRLNPSDVENYVREAVTYGKGVIDIVEVFNELNLPLEWGTSPTNPEAFVPIQQAAYRGAKAADPNVIVSAPAPSPRTGGFGGTMEDVEWLDRFYKAGGGNWMDVQGFHPYPGNHRIEAEPVVIAAAPTDSTEAAGGPVQALSASLTGLASADPEQQGCVPMCFRLLEQWRKVMERNGLAGKNAIVTEVGTVHHTPIDLGQYDWMKLEHQLAADRAVRMFQYGHATYPWLRGILYFNLDFATAYPDGDGRHWFGVLNPNKSPRPAYNALKGMSKPG